MLGIGFLADASLGTKHRQIWAGTRRRVLQHLCDTPTGIGPEVFAYMGPNGSYTGRNITAGDIEFYEQHGWYVYDGGSHYYL
jgi:hypothetical protein